MKPILRRPNTSARHSDSKLVARGGRAEHSASRHRYAYWFRVFFVGLVFGGSFGAESASGQGGSPAPVRGAIEWSLLSTANGDLEIPTGAGSEQTATLILDINKDGVNDFVIGDRNATPSLVWYRREVNGWTKFVIDDTPLLIEAGGAAFDIDRDGDLDVVEGGDVRSNQIWWWENPYPNFAPSTPWVRRLIKNGGANQHHDCIFGDFDGDGAGEFVFWNQGSSPTLYLAEIPANPRDGALWPYVPIYTTTGLAEGLTAGDIDGDGIEDIIGGGYWFKFAGGTTYTPNAVDPAQAFSRAAVGQIIPGGRPEIVFVIGDSKSVPAIDGKGPLLFYQWNGTSWDASALLPFDTDHGHSLDIVDFNRDGHLDIFNAEMDLLGNDDATLRIFYGDSQGHFVLQQVAVGVDNHESKIGDLDGDGDLDILGKPFADSPGVNVWINERVELGVLPLDQWERHSVDPAQPWLSVFALPGDLDGDGLTDIASGGWWYRNTGDYGSWVRHTIGAPLNNVALLYDFDGDGDLDILGTSGQTQTPTHPGPPELSWARNDGFGNFTVLSNVTPGNTTDPSSTFVQGIHPAFFQDGGPLQVAISWNFGEFGFSGIDLLSVPANPSQQIWPLETVSPFSEGEELAVADLDGDGDLDLFQGSGWLRNDAGTWTRISVTDLIGNNAPYDDADRVRLADLDGDGDLDAVVGLLFETAAVPVDMVWLEHPADPEQEWPLHVVAPGVWGGFSLSVEDMDNDGDPDIVLGEHVGLTRLLIFENNGDASGWTQHVADPGGTGIDHHDGALAVDFDGDGDFDIVSLGWTNQKVWLFENHAVELDPNDDREPPSIPAALAAQPYSSARVDLSWERSIDNRGFVQRYQIHRDGSLIGIATDTSFADQTVTELSAYAYTVVAVDLAGNSSNPSAPAVATTPAYEDVPPSAPGSLVATVVSPIRVDLSWIASTDNVGVVGYTVTQDGVVVDTPPTPRSVRTRLLPNTTYIFSVSAFDAEGNVSDPVLATIQMTTPAPVTGLWGAWAFEESSGIDAALDSSGYENDGVLENNAGRSGSGYFGSALELSGATGRVNLGPLDVYSNQLTIMMWINADDFGNYDARLISKSSSAQEQDHVWMLSTFTGPTVRFRLKTGSGVTSTLVASTGTLQAGTWHHVAGTYDGSAMRVFLDGNLVGSRSKTGAIARDPNMEVWIGSNPGTFDQVFDGRIDEVRVVGTALSAAEISQAMTDPLPLPSGDDLAPSIPSAVEATAVSPSQIDVTWTASADDVGVAGYGVHRDGVQVATATTTSYSDGGLAPTTTYAYTVVAFDAAGNVSATSSPAAVAVTLNDSTGPCGDGIDNDGDGLIDGPPLGNDPGCQTVLSARENPKCDDDIDNDVDGRLDWDGAGVGEPDPQCVGKPWRNRESASSCGLGHEIVFLLPILRVLRMRRRAGPQSHD
jgi:chitodextrinase